MYDLVGPVRDWQRAGLDVSIVRLVDTRGLSSRERAACLAIAADRPPAGALLAGSLDATLAAAVAGSTERRLLSVTVTDAAADRAGLSCGGVARVLVEPAAAIPDAAWSRLAAQLPVCLATDLTGEAPGPTRVLDEVPDGDIARLVKRGTSESAVLTDARGAHLVTSLWPTPRVLVVGAGLIAEALAGLAAVLGWQCSTVADLAGTSLSAADAVVVLDHDLDVSGRALTAALVAPTGYIGALGSRHTQAARADWLAAHGVTGLDRIHGPAGLDIGSRTAGEIALSILAEALAVRTGRNTG